MQFTIPNHLRYAEIHEWTGERDSAVGNSRAVSGLTAPVAERGSETDHRPNDRPKLADQGPLGAGWLVGCDHKRGTGHLLAAAESREQV